MIVYFRNLNAKILILLLSIMTCVSCNKGILFFYGIKQPNPKTEKQIRKAIKKYNLNNYEHITMNNTGLDSLLRVYKSPNFVILFNENGYRIDLIESKNCISKYEELISSTINSSSNVTYVDSIHQLKDFWTNIISLDGNSLVYPQNGKYITFVSWATYIGRFNKTHSKFISDLIFHSVKDSFKVYYLNMDFKK